MLRCTRQQPYESGYSRRTVEGMELTFDWAKCYLGSTKKSRNFSTPKRIGRSEKVRLYLDLCEAFIANLIHCAL